MDNLDFEQEFTSDAEVEEALDCLTELLNGASDDGKPRIAVANVSQVQSVLYTYQILKYLTKGADVQVSYELNAPYISMGSVSIRGKNIMFNRPEWLLIVAKLASNVNVYPQTNGMIRMDFTFHGLTTTIAKED